MNPTIQEVLNLYKKGTITILHDGKAYFRKQVEKKEAVGQQPNDSKELKNNYEVIIPIFS